MRMFLLGITLIVAGVAISPQASAANCTDAGSILNDAQECVVETVGAASRAIDAVQHEANDLRERALELADWAVCQAICE